MFKEKVISSKTIISIILFIIATCIFYFVPYSQDDWGWGTQIGLDRLYSMFDGYNGRWVGNISIIILSRLRLVKAIFCSLVMLGIIVLSKKIVNDKNKQLSFLMLLLIFVIPINIIAQSITWVSGFVNYVTPVLLILLFIYLNKDIFKNKNSSLGNKYIVPLLILGFLTSLFIENLTIYNLLLAISIVVYEIIKTKKINLPNFSYLIGSIIGTVFMFSNSAYNNITNGVDEYRTIDQYNIILNAIHSYYKYVYKYLFNGNTIINILIGILLIIIVYIYIKNNKISKRKKYILYTLSLLVIGYSCYLFFDNFLYFGNMLITNRYNHMVKAFVPIIYYIAIFILLLMTLKDKILKNKIIFLFASLVFINAPLLIVSPIGPRCFFANYIFFCLIALELYNYISNYYKINILNIFITICLIFSIFYLLIFGYIFKIESIRNDEIKKHSEDSELVLPKIPHSRYLWLAEPKKSSFEFKFKLFYNINKDAKIIFVSYKDFKNQKVNK